MEVEIANEFLKGRDDELVAKEFAIVSKMSYRRIILRARIPNTFMAIQRMSYLGG